MTSSFSISSCFGVSVSLIRLPSKRNLREVIGTPCKRRIRRWINMKRTYNSFRVTPLQLRHRGGHFHSEMNLIRILSHHFKLDVLRVSIVTGSGWFRFLSSTILSHPSFWTFHLPLHSTFCCCYAEVRLLPEYRGWNSDSGRVMNKGQSKRRGAEESLAGWVPKREKREEREERERREGGEREGKRRRPTTGGIGGKVEWGCPVWVSRRSCLLPSSRLVMRTRPAHGSWFIVLTTGARCHLSRERGKREQVCFSSSLSHLQSLHSHPSQPVSVFLPLSSFLLLFPPSTHSEENSVNPISDITSSSNLVDVVSDSIIILLGSWSHIHI